MKQHHAAVICDENDMNSTGTHAVLVSIFYYHSTWVWLWTYLDVWKPEFARPPVVLCLALEIIMAFPPSLFDENPSNFGRMAVMIGRKSRNLEKSDVWLILRHMDGQDISEV